MRRTIAKTATYAVMHFTVAIGVAYALTRDWQIALAVGLVEPAVQTVAFAIHEKLWARHSEKVAPPTGLQRMLDREEALEGDAAPPGPDQKS
jgi:uncharacterized membrane protein